MPKFNIGDKVKIVGAIANCKQSFIGDVVTIDAYSELNLTHEFAYVVKGSNAHNFLWTDYELELVKEKDEMPKFKIGDKVNIVGYRGSESLWSKYVGLVSTVVDIRNEPHNDPSYVLEDIPGVAWFNDELELVKEKYKMKKEFTKKDLKSGDVIKRRNGTIEIFISDLNVFICDNGGYAEIKCIRDDLKSIMVTDRDIVAVRRIKRNDGNPFQAFQHEYGELVYERKEVEEMTLAEVCKALGKEIKIVKG